jgi:outer membrane receptor protein involved in Fe transport
MRLSATWLSYSIDNLVSAAANPLDACYSSIAFSSASCGVNPHTGLPLIRRDPATEQVVAIESLLMNGGEYRWKGLDFEFDYVVEPARGPIDRVWISGLHTLALKAESRQIDQTAAMRLDGLAANPRNRSRVSIGAETGPLALNLFVQRRGRVSTIANFDIPETRIPAVTTVDLTARFEIRDKAVVTFGVENLTDRDAPLAAFAGPTGGNTYPEYYDLVGRRFSIGVRVAM